MTLTTAIGLSQALDSSEAGAQASRIALSQVGRQRGRVPAVLGLVVHSHDYPAAEVLDGVSSILGDTPLLGFSTSAELTSSGQTRRSVVVALLAGSDIKARAGWWPGAAGDGYPGEGAASPMNNMLQAFLPELSEGVLLLIGEGLHGDASRLTGQLSTALRSVPAGAAPIIAGCLSGGQVSRDRTFQIGGRQAGSDGLAAAWVTGKILAGVGVSHGWSSVGPYFHVTESRGPWIVALNEQPAYNAYAGLFGYEPREWALPPLNELVRLYPLNVELEKDEEGVDLPTSRCLVRSPLSVESDGSLRMNAAIPQGGVGHILVGSVTNCLEAAKQAARQALLSISNAATRRRAILAILLIDEAWRMLFESQPGEEMQAVRSVLGADIPIIGGYTFGQIASTAPSGPVDLLNQHIEVIVFAEDLSD